MNEVAGLLDSTYSNLSIAVAAEQSGNFASAAKHYREAAANLFEAARYSSGQLKLARVEGAETLLQRASSVDSRVKEEARIQSNTEYQGGLDLVKEIGIAQPELPAITFDDVAGLDQIKTEVRNKIIYPMMRPDLAGQYGIKAGGGILLFGPPGTGKTYIVKAIAHEVNALFLSVNPSSLVSQWFGEFEKNITKLFTAARMCAPTVLFFDEIDALAPRRRSSSSSVMKRAVPQLLAELGGIVEKKERSVLIIGATNNPWDIDEAILRPGRFDEKIYVPLPDEPARRRIFELSLKGMTLSQDINLDELAHQTDGYTGADIAYVCRKAGENVFRNAVEGGEQRPVGTQDLLKSISEVRPSVTRQMVIAYEDYLKRTVLA